MKKYFSTSYMRHCKSTLHYWMCGVALALVLPLSVSAGSFEDYRFPRESSFTKDGYPTPLSGKPITKTRVIAKKKGVTLKKYPEHYIPGKEKLGDNKMLARIYFFLNYPWADFLTFFSFSALLGLYQALRLAHSVAEGVS